MMTRECFSLYTACASLHYTGRFSISCSTDLFIELELLAFLLITVRIFHMKLSLDNK